MSEKFKILDKLLDNIKKRKNSNPSTSYTAKLFLNGKVKIANKFGEESIETISAFLNQEKKDLIEETADLLYHLFVLLEHADVSLSDITKVLEKRMKK